MSDASPRSPKLNDKQRERLQPGWTALIVKMVAKSRRYQHGGHKVASRV